MCFGWRIDSVLGRRQNLKREVFLACNFFCLLNFYDFRLPIDTNQLDNFLSNVT